MAPTGRYRPGQLVWVKTRASSIEHDHGFDSVPKREDCEVGLIIRAATDDEIELWSGFDPTIMVIFILKREKTLPYEERFIYPIDTFPLEEDD